MSAPRRLDPQLSRLPVEEIRAGYYSDVYFNRARTILEADGSGQRIRMQVFQRTAAILCGIDESLALLRAGSGAPLEDGDWREGWDELTVHALRDGDAIGAYETVMTISGEYSLFAHLETLYLG